MTTTRFDGFTAADHIAAARQALAASENAFGLEASTMYATQTVAHSNIALFLGQPAPAQPAPGYVSINLPVAQTSGPYIEFSKPVDTLNYLAHPGVYVDAEGDFWLVTLDGKLILLTNANDPGDDLPREGTAYTAYAPFRRVIVEVAE